MLDCHVVKVYAHEYDLEDFAPLWLEKVRRALALIEALSPTTARRLSRDVRLIVVDAVQGPEYLHAPRAIRLHGPAVTRAEPSRIALTIVHEATHARIASRRIPYTTDQRARHERACTQAAARFAKRLPDGERLASALVERLDSPWWTDDAMQARALNQFDRLKLTGPVARFLRRRIQQGGHLDD